MLCYVYFTFLFFTLSYGVSYLFYVLHFIQLYFNFTLFFCRTTLLHIPTADETQTFRFHKTSQSLYHRSGRTTRTCHLFLSYQLFSLFLFFLFHYVFPVYFKKFQIIFIIMITVIITSSISIMFLFYHLFLLIDSVLNFMCATFLSYFILC